MIVVKFSGGLGNQMYQYAIYSLLKKKYPQTEIKADISFYNLLCEHNGFEIDKVFITNEKIEYASKKEITKFCSKYIPGKLASKMPQRIKTLIAYNLQYKLSRIKGWLNKEKALSVVNGLEINVYNPLIYCLNVKEHDFYLDGLWQNVQYFADDVPYIKSIFQYKNDYGEYEEEVSRQIQNCNSVSLHIRRGDFCGTVLDICDISYYKRAMNEMKKKLNDITWFVFSDDISFARSIIDDNNVVFVKGNKQKAYYDLMLMSECKHNILSNSTFSFWASFLNNNDEKIVIAPRFCVKNEIGNYEFSLPDNYIQIEV